MRNNKTGRRSTVVRIGFVNTVSRRYLHLCYFCVEAYTCISSHHRGKELMWRRLWSTLVQLPRNSGSDALGSLHRPLFNVNSDLLPIVGWRPKSGSKKVDLTYLIPEEDLVEKFITGWGPGGQAVAKTHNACYLKHVPTGELRGKGREKSPVDAGHI